MRLPLVLTLVAAAQVAHAQPADPYAEPPTPLAPAADPALDEQVATSLVARAQQLYDARVYADAKQLAVEALAKSPDGAAGQQARFLIGSIDRQLGIVDARPQTSPATVAPTPRKAVAEAAPIEQPPGEPGASPRASRLSTAVHAGLYVGLLGTTIGAFAGEQADGTTSAGAPLLIGAVAGGVAAAYLPGPLGRLAWSEGQIRTAGSISVWTGVVGGMIGDLADTDATNARQVLVGASVGATAGILAGAALAQRDRYTPGDLALVDTFAGIGTAGGFTLGMLMQPAKSEAYSLNAAVGAAGGAIIGLVAGPQTNTTPRRMARVAGLAAAGGALPFLIYAAAYDESTDSDERSVGALSSIGLVAGAWLGFRLTANLDAGLDVKPGRRVRAADEAAPISLIMRRADGGWAAGALTVQPLARALAPQRGMTVPLLGGAF